MPRINFTVRKLDSLKPQATRVDYYDTSLPGFLLRVTPSGEKVFSVMYRIGGYRRRYTLGGFPVLQLVDAREQARDALELVRRGIPAPSVDGSARGRGALHALEGYRR